MNEPLTKEDVLYYRKIANLGAPGTKRMVQSICDGWLQQHEELEKLKEQGDGLYLAFNMKHAEKEHLRSVMAQVSINLRGWPDRVLPEVISNAVAKLNEALEEKEVEEDIQPEKEKVYPAKNRMAAALTRAGAGQPPAKDSLQEQET